ncbi:hypothetical protein BCR32DRAFT_270272 [Anaeromyces robustus]|uniref:Uncharacterized protein n=1 Tax=Anaeromyces robustus TaxID=1754192 RepID=A0A1Y1WWY7_9FUNG|nr:hypothetical protein BCR32DRAFT_270272 [Anaeromyces robustus]|eukprot:ORX78069.1 hypothetical protein BCR32DRAFT_270272 [Anaeromyces robustus]
MEYDNENIDMEQENLKTLVQEKLVREKNIKDAIDASEEERNRRIVLEKKANQESTMLRIINSNIANKEEDNEQKRRELAHSVDNLTEMDKTKKKSIEKDLIHEVHKRELKRNSIDKGTAA